VLFWLLQQHLEYHCVPCQQRHARQQPRKAMQLPDFAEAMYSAEQGPAKNQHLRM
jgi:hypothetical protein